MEYQALSEAFEVLELKERASRKELRQRYRDLARRHHPDAGSPDEQRMRQINQAYALLQSYLQHCRYSFSEQEFYEQQPKARLRRQFADDPLWRDRWIKLTLTG